MARRAASLALLLCAALTASSTVGVSASNPYTSNVIALTPRNFKQLKNSPHVWFVNVCRVG